MKYFMVCWDLIRILGEDSLELHDEKIDVGLIVSADIQDVRESEINQFGWNTKPKGSVLESASSMLELETRFIRSSCLTQTLKGTISSIVALLSLTLYHQQLSSLCIRSLFTLLFYFRQTCVSHCQRITARFFKGPLQCFSLEQCPEFSEFS